MKNSTKASLKLKKRWFLLTHNSLDYYKSSERNALKLGTLVLNRLCSVVQPDEKVFKETGKMRNPPEGDLQASSRVVSPLLWRCRVLERDRVRPQTLVPTLLQAAE